MLSRTSYGCNDCNNSVGDKLVSPATIIFKNGLSPSSEALHGKIALVSRTIEHLIFDKQYCLIKLTENLIPSLYQSSRILINKINVMRPTNTPMNIGYRRRNFTGLNFN